MAIPFLVSVAAVTWAWQSTNRSLNPVLVLSQGAQRGSNTPKVSLSEGGPVLLLELRVPDVIDRPATARVQEIGGPPLLQMHYPRWPVKSLLVPIPRQALQAG